MQYHSKFHVSLRSHGESFFRFFDHLICYEKGGWYILSIFTYIKIISFIIEPTFSLVNPKKLSLNFITLLIFLQLDFEILVIYISFPWKHFIDNHMHITNTFACEKSNFVYKLINLTLCYLYIYYNTLRI